MTKNRFKSVLDINYAPLPAQSSFHRATSKFRAYVGGYGSGKTFAGCHEAIWLSYLNPGLTGMMLAPTMRMLEDATLTTFKEILDRAGVKYKYHSSEGRLTLPWGSRVIFRSADNPAHLKGPNLAWVGVDEGALISKTAWEVAISRIRHPAASRLSAFITTTPEGFNWLYEEFIEKRRRGYRLIRAATSENIHLPAEYVQDLEAAYDPALVRQYLMGEFTNPASGRAYHSFNRAIHVRRDVSYSPGLPICAAIDFNVDPLHAAIIQLEGDDIYIVDEIVLHSSNTYELCRELQYRYGDSRITAYPDPTGRARKTSGHPDAPTDFAILMNHGIEIRSRTGSPAVKDRINAVNRKLLSPDGVPGVYISDRCRETIRSFEQTTFKPGSVQLDKSAGAEHMTDAVGYLIEYEFPIRTPQRVEYEGVSPRKTTRRGF